MIEETNVGNTRGKSYKDIQLAYLTDGGVSAVKALFEAQEASQASIEKAAEKLNRADLNDWCEATFPEKPKGKRPGRVGPQRGETRTYKVQNTNDTGEFLRLPLPKEVINVVKGDSVKVHFGVDGVISVYAD